MVKSMTVTFTVPLSELGGTLFMVTLILLRHQSSARFADGNGLKGFVHLEEVEEDTLAAQHGNRQQKRNTYLMASSHPTGPEKQGAADKHIHLMDKPECACKVRIRITHIFAGKKQRKFRCGSSL
jgi:hypothetical protein